MSRKDYEDVKSHMDYHDVKGWLLTGCKDEDANTIRHFVEMIPEETLKRRLARALTKDT